MKIFLRLLIISTVLASLQLPGQVQAAESTQLKSVAPAVKRKVVRRNYLQTGVGLIFWHESIKINRDAEVAEMLAQFSGISFFLGYDSAISARWYQSHKAQIGYGQLKGEVALGTDNNLFKNQPWLSLGYVPALYYRSTSTTDIGFSLPLVTRIIQWKLAANSNVAMDKKTSFTAGLALDYVQRLNTKESLRFTVGTLSQWQSNFWNFSWDYAFR